jgi:membrane protease YdiL (CAAX protease family)
MPTPADEIARLSRDVARLTAAPGAPAGAPVGAPASVAAPAPPAPRGYLAATRTATYGFFATLPLFVLYEAGVLLTSAGPGGVRVGADVWLKSLLAAVGLVGWAALGGVVLLVGAAVVWAERRRRPPLRAGYFGGIVLESLAYAVGLALVVGTAVGLLFNAAALPVAAALQGAGGFSLPLKLALSIGAGLYEELVFRVLLVGGLFLVLRRLLPARAQAYAVAALVGAVVFSLVHYLGPYGDPFALSSFTFRFLFGLALNAVFLLRGFAVAAWTHALYDVLVVTGAFG